MYVVLGLWLCMALSHRHTRPTLQSLKELYKSGEVESIECSLAPV